MGRWTQNPNHPDVIRTWERRTRVVSRRAEGISIAKIAEEEGISTATVQNDVRREMERRADEWEKDGSTAKIRQFEAAKLDALEKDLWPRLQEPKEWARAVQAILRVAEMRMKLLGLETPVVQQTLSHVKVDVSLADGSLPPGSEIVDGEIVEPKEIEAGED